MRSLSTLIKPVSGSCNMRCGYCFYADVAEHRGTENYGHMKPETLEQLVKKALAETTGHCVFGFQGGEPTLAGMNFFRSLIELEDKYNIHGAKIEHTMQTNGLILDEAWAAFLAEHDFLVGISIDASKQVHDAMRIDAAGKGTHSRCMRAARLLEKSGGRYNILSVVTRQLAAHPDKAYRFYKQSGFRFLQFIPCLDGLEEDHGAHGHSLTAVQYGKFLCRIFDLWYADFVSGDYYSIRIFDNYIRIIAGQPPENCAMAGRCNAYLLVEADGSVFPCDFYAVDEHRLGNILTDEIPDLLTGTAARGFMEASHCIHPDCENCSYFAICRGGCRRDREPVVDGMPAKNIYCEAYKLLFAHALPRMTQIARQLFSR